MESRGENGKRIGDNMLDFDISEKLKRFSICVWSSPGLMGAFYEMKESVFYAENANQD